MTDATTDGPTIEDAVVTQADVSDVAGRPEQLTILVTGATGYVGGRLAPRLLEEGYRVRVLVRGGAGRLHGRPWADAVEVVDGDVLDPASLVDALRGVDAAYYLIHSMGGSAGFRQRDHEAARNFGVVCAMSGVQRILYLGGLGDPESNLSEHLRSRQETGEVLRRSGVPVTEFRAGMVVGSGSISFEMMRHLTERLPVMICPRWVFTNTQPIAIRDVLNYLVAALATPASANRVVEIGGADIVTYADMMLGYAAVRGLKRWMIPVPVLTPWLSSYWVHWMTPIPAGVARPLILGLRNETVVQGDSARELFPHIQPMSYRAAVQIALDSIERGEIETLWSDALASSMGDLPPVFFAQEQGLLIERRRLRVDAPPAQVYRAFARLGGARGWPSYNWLWSVRGALDRLAGGVGMRRGRRNADDLREGDALDFWRVERIWPGQSILLRAEMKLPGHGWLSFEATPLDDGAQTELVQTAYFAPKGLFGLLYWYLLYPLHGVIFSAMIRNLTKDL